jgi:hypothetical protein
MQSVVLTDSSAAALDTSQNAEFANALSEAVGVLVPTDTANTASVTVEADTGAVIQTETNEPQTPTLTPETAEFIANVAANITLDAEDPQVAEAFNEELRAYIEKNAPDEQKPTFEAMAEALGQIITAQNYDTAKEPVEPIDSGGQTEAIPTTATALPSEATTLPSEPENQDTVLTNYGEEEQGGNQGVATQQTKQSESVVIPTMKQNEPLQSAEPTPQPDLSALALEHLPADNTQAESLPQVARETTTPTSSQENVVQDTASFFVPDSSAANVSDTGAAAQQQATQTVAVTPKNLAEAAAIQPKNAVYVRVTTVTVTYAAQEVYEQFADYLQSDKGIQQMNRIQRTELIQFQSVVFIKPNTLGASDSTAQALPPDLAEVLTALYGEETAANIQNLITGTGKQAAQPTTPLPQTPTAELSAPTTPAETAAPTTAQSCGNINAEAVPVPLKTAVVPQPTAVVNETLPIGPLDVTLEAPQFDIDGVEVDDTPFSVEVDEAEEIVEDEFDVDSPDYDLKQKNITTTDLFGRPLTEEATDAGDVSADKAAAFDKADVGKQIGESIQKNSLKLLASDDGTTKYEVVLNPESLGKITIKLTDNAGKISIELIADDPETQLLLHHRSDGLEHAIRQTGIDLDGYTVSEPQKSDTYEEERRQQQEQARQEQEANEQQDEQADETPFSDFLSTLGGE